MMFGNGVKYLCLVVLMFLPTQLIAKDEHLLMQDAVRTFVAETGYQVVGIGSWVGGKGYTPGVSDHDLRLILPEGVSARESQKIWADARSKLKKTIQEAHKANPMEGASVDDILALTNFYPPDQMMGDVPDMEKAWVKFKEADTFPNLAAEADKAKIEAAEGLYGNGAKYWRQEYEGKKGSWFYKGDNGEVIEGSVETIHAAERIGAQTMAGRANTAAQWVEHAWDTMREGGDARTVGKYLMRMSEDLDEAMAKGGLSGRPGWMAEARALGRHLKKHPDSFARNEDLVRSLLKQGYRESAIAAEYATSTGAKRQYMRAIQASCANGKGCLLDRLIKRARALGKPLSFAHAAQLASVAMDVGGVASATTESERAEAIYSSLAWTAGWPVGLMSFAVEEGRAEATALGIATVAQFQDVWDMMEGNYSSSGRAKTDEVSWPLHRLVSEIHDEKKLQERVAVMARRASARGFGVRSGESDAALAERLLQKAWPIVFQAWSERRAEINALITQELLKLQIKPVQVSYAPNPAEIEPDITRGNEGKWHPIEVRVSLENREKRIETTFDNIKKLMALLGETGKGNVAIFPKWDGGHRGRSSLEQVYVFKEPGEYIVTAAPRIFVSMTKHSEDVMFNQSIDLKVGANVWVVPPQASQTGTRVVNFREATPVVFQGECKSGSEHTLTFRFPIDGGEITDFSMQYWVGYAVCLKTSYVNGKLNVEEDPTCSHTVTCHSLNGRSRLISGYFDGGDGGALTLTMRDEDSDGSVEVTEIVGRIWANGTAKIGPPDDDISSYTTLNFPPF